MNGLLLVASFALFVTVSLAAEPCGARGRSCVAGRAECVSGKCQCTAPYVKGDGAFACYKEETVAAEIFNDPMLTNFNNESISFPFPCRYLTTHVMNDLKDSAGNVIGSCEFMIYSFNAKYRGKFFLHGFDIAMGIQYFHAEHVKMSSRHHGIARDGDYKFKSKATLGEFQQNGPWGNEKINYKDETNGVYVSVSKDKDNNQLVYNAEQCGLRITFVPYDIYARRSQASVPGLSIGVNTQHDPRWLSNDKVTALAPVSQGGSYFVDHWINRLSVEQSIFARAYKQNFVQNMPMNEKGKCVTAHHVVRKCTRPELRKAMKNCYWILKEPRFIYCMDKSHNARKILRLFNSCIRVWCARIGTCSKLTDMILKKQCENTRDIPELPDFMTGSMCPAGR